MALSINQKKKLAKTTVEPGFASWNAVDLKMYMAHRGISYADTDTLAQLKAKLVSFSKNNGYCIYVGDIE